MAEKQGLTLSQVLQDFESSLRGEEKTAQEAEPESQEKTAEKTTESESQEKTAEETGELSSEAVTSLKEIAKTASEQNEHDMTKEASEFGRIFAHSFMQELQLNSDLEKSASEAYQAMQEKVAEQQLTQVYDEAYMQSMAKVAGEAAYAEAARQMNLQPGVEDALNHEDQGSEETKLAEEDVQALTELVKEAYQATSEYLADE